MTHSAENQFIDQDHKLHMYIMLSSAASAESMTHSAKNQFIDWDYKQLHVCYKIANAIFSR